MKFKTICLLFLVFTFNLNAQEAKLSGKITNPTGKSVYLLKFEMTEQGRVANIVDSCVLSQTGEFSLKVLFNELTLLLFFDGNENTELLLEPHDDIYMTLNTKFFDETILYTGKGSEKNNLKKTLGLINENIREFMGQNIHNEDTLHITSRIDASYDSLISLVKDYIKTMPDLREHLMEIIEGYETEKTYRKESYLNEINMELKVRTLIGKKAIDFEGIDLNGKPTKLSDYKGKLILLDFWATWCGPCRYEFPYFKELEEKYADIHFLSVGVYCKEEDWKKMATKESFKNNIFLSKEAENQIKEYIVAYIPRYILIDENFNIINPRTPSPSSGDLERLLSTK